MRLCRLSELRAVQIRIEPVLRQQLIVRTLLDDVAVLHDQDHIRIADGGKAVRNDKAGPALHQMIHCLLDQNFGSGIYGRSRGCKVFK